MYNQDIVRRPLKDLTVSATLRKMMDFSEVTGDPRGASRPELWSKARPSRRALSFRNLLINWLVGEKCKPIIIRDAGGAPRASPWHHLVSPIHFANGGT